MAVGFPKAPRLVYAILIVAAIVTALAARQHFIRHKGFACHEAGRIYRSAWLEPDVCEELIRKHRIKTVINLCCPEEKQARIEAEREAVERSGARLIEIVYPVNASSHVDDESFRETEQIFDDPEAYPIWIHCWHGRQRTAKALVIFDIARRGLSPDEALERACAGGSATPALVAFARNYGSFARVSIAARRQPAE